VKKKFSVEQIVSVSKQAEVGVPIAELIRKVGISEQTVLSLEVEVRWPGGGPDPSTEAAAGPEHAAEAVGGRTDAGQDDASGRAQKKVVKPSRHRPFVKYLEQSYRVSERHACCVLEVARATHRYEGHQERGSSYACVSGRSRRPGYGYGYRMIRVLLNREGWKVGKDLVYRLYREEGLGLRKRPAGKRRAAVHRRERLRPTGPNQVWAMDFVADQLRDGRRIRSLTIVDIFT
jgi:hypothetical protein